MNWNAIRTAMASLGTALLALANYAPQVLGCTAKPVSVTDVLSSLGASFDCTHSWLPPTWAAGAGIGLWILTLAAKAATQGGTILENLTKPSVAVTPVAKPGTVTPAQVASVAALKQVAP